MVSCNKVVFLFTNNISHLFSPGLDSLPSSRLLSHHTTRCVMHEGVLRDDLSNGFHKAVFALRSVTIRLELTDEYQRP